MIDPARLERANGSWDIICPYLLRRVDLPVFIARLPIEGTNTVESCRWRAIRYETRHLQSFVRSDQAKAMSRIGLESLTRREAEESRIKCARLLKEASESLLRQMRLRIKAIGRNLSSLRLCMIGLVVCWTYHFVGIKPLL